MIGFSIQKEYLSSRESLAIINSCNSLGVSWCVDEFSIDRIPIGSVEWVEEWLLKLGIKRPIPDYYPKWAESSLKRKINKCEDKQELLTFLGIYGDLYIKPADRYKKFTGYKVSKDSVDGILYPIYASQVIPDIKNEWRYYIVNGEVLCGWWYMGDESCVDDNPPKLNLNIPNSFCGASDFAETTAGELILIENHHPYAIGWYGDDFLDYYKFIVSGWSYLLS